MQINPLTLLGGLAALLILPVFAQSEYSPVQPQYQGVEPLDGRQDTFKCFIDTNVGPGIYAFTWAVSDTRSNMQTLPGSRLVNSAMAARGVQVYAIKVHECVRQAQSFKASSAQALDEGRAQ